MLENDVVKKELEGDEAGKTGDAAGEEQPEDTATVLAGIPGNFKNVKELARSYANLFQAGLQQKRQNELLVGKVLELTEHMAGLIQGGRGPGEKPAGGAGDESLAAQFKQLGLDFDKLTAYVESRAAEIAQKHVQMGLKPWQEGATARARLAKLPNFQLFEQEVDSFLEGHPEVAEVVGQMPNPSAAMEYIYSKWALDYALTRGKPVVTPEQEAARRNAGLPGKGAARLPVMDKDTLKKRQDVASAYAKNEASLDELLATLLEGVGPNMGAT